MKCIELNLKAAKLAGLDPRKTALDRLPKDFLFLLMEKLVSDLAELPSQSGDVAPLCHPDIDLSGVYKAIRSRDLKTLLEATKPLGIQRILPRWEDQPEKVFGLYQLHTLLKKYPLSGDDCARQAYRTFVEYERHCQLYNTDNWRALARLNVSHPDYLGIIEEIQEDIVRCIGDKPPLDSIYCSAKHGPGTALGHYANEVTSYFKWSVLPYTVSPKARPYAIEAITSDPRWIGALLDRYREEHEIPQYMPVSMSTFWEWVLQCCDYCKYSTVPKSAETDRSIGIEPKLNVYLQLGVDGVIRRRLRQRWGVDINSQLLNQHLATQSSVSDEDATIDLRGASDCVSLMAANMLLPPAWFGLLLDLRSENILVSGFYTGGKEELRPLAKISAMGNGFTFALETLIFASICRAIMRRRKCKGNLAVFGDDIIVPKQVAPAVIDLLGLFGFETNVDKTFVEGPFRESCGVDCLRGTNIRPLFLKRPVTKVQDLWYLINSLSALERRLPFYWEISFKTTKDWLYSFIPKAFRQVVGPPSESLDTYLHVERTRYDRNGVTKHFALVQLAQTFNDRAPDWFFRKLMVTLRPAIDEGVLDGTRLLSLSDIVRSGPGIKEGAVPQASAFDVTLRGVTRTTLVIRKAWKS